MIWLIQGNKSALPRTVELVKEKIISVLAVLESSQMNFANTVLSDKYYR